MEWHCFKDYSLIVETDLQMEDLKDYHKFTHKGLKCPHCGLAFIKPDWYCYKDKVKMVETDIELRYELSAEHKMSATQKGLKCPVCGISFFLEYFTLTRLVSAEERFESK